MNEKLASRHLAACGVEIHMLDNRSPEEIVKSMVESGVIPPLEVLQTEGMTLPADQLEPFALRTDGMSVADKINC